MPRGLPFSSKKLGMMGPGVKRNSPLAKFTTIGLSAHASSKFMTLTLINYPNPNPNPIPCEILDVEILDACADSPIVENFASGEFRATPGRGHSLESGGT